MISASHVATMLDWCFCKACIESHKLQYSDPSWLAEEKEEEEEQITYRPRGPSLSFGEGMG